MYLATNVANFRLEPDSKSERITQAVFNQECTVKDEEDEWLLCVLPDETEGWIRKVYMTQERYCAGSLWRVEKLYAPAVYSDSEQLATKFTFNTLIYGKTSGGDVVTRWNDHRTIHLNKNDLKPASAPKDFLALGELAKRFIGIPYLWGGSSTFGLDCSGFTQLLFSYHGIKLPRNSTKQEEEGHTVTTSSDKQVLCQEPELGDLLFFPGHVGIYLADGLMIHSCSHENGVAITNLGDDSEYSQYLRDQLTAIKRVYENYTK